VQVGVPDGDFSGLAISLVALVASFTPDAAIAVAAFWGGLPFANVPAAGANPLSCKFARSIVTGSMWHPVWNIACVSNFGHREGCMGRGGPVVEGIGLAAGPNKSPLCGGASDCSLGSYPGALPIRPHADCRCTASARA